MLYEFLIVKQGRIIYYSKIKRINKEFDIKNVKKLLSKKTHGNHATVYLVRKDEADVLIDKFSIVFGMRKWDRFIKKLALLSNLPLYEEEA